MSTAIETIRDRHAGHQCVSIGYMRPGDSRKPPTVRLQVLDSEMNLIILLDMDPKQFTDVLSGMNTWVQNQLGPNLADREQLVGFATWLSQQEELDVSTPDEAVDLYLRSLK